MGSYENGGSWADLDYVTYAAYDVPKSYQNYSKFFKIVDVLALIPISIQI